MDRRTIVAVVLSIAIYYGWLYFRGPQLQEIADREAAEAETAQSTEVVPVDPAVLDPSEAPQLPPVAVGPSEQAVFEACGSISQMSTTTGLSDVILENHQGPFLVQPLYTWIWGKIRGTVEGSWHPWGEEEPGRAQVLTEHARALTVGTGAGPAVSAPANMTVVRASTSQLELSGTTPEGLEVTQTLTAGQAGGHCVLDVEIAWRNPMSSAWDGGLWLGVHEVVNDGTGGMAARYQSQRQPTAVTDSDLSYGGPTGAGCVQAGTRLSEEERGFALPGPVSWFGISDRYFGFYIMPEDPTAGTAWLSRIGAGEAALDGTHLQMSPAIEAGGVYTQRFQAFVGPNDMDLLGEVHDDLQRVVDLGWFAFFGYPLLWLLRLFQSVVGNWGVAIVMLTLVVKIVFFPMTQRSFRSMQKLQKLQPELNKLREELKDNPQEMNRRIFEVMQENQVNPAAGCLPMVVQMPVWIALYNVLLTSVDLYHTEFLYLRDLTQPDPWLFLPITIMVLMFVQQRFSTPANMDPAQQQVMRLMPLFFGLLFFAFPSGLAVYVFVNMVLSNLQQWLIKRSIDSGDSPGVVAAT